MKIESMTAEVRPRIGWEAIDLGFIMVRTWWKPVYVPWLLSNIVAAAIVFVSLWNHLWLAMFILWWLKPLFNRIPLHVMSQALFGTHPGAGETLRAVPRLFGFHLVRTLTVNRFDLARSFNLPVWQLENLSGLKRRERLRVLQKTASNSSVWLTMICLLFSLVVSMSALLLVWLMVPEGIADGLQDYVWGSRAEEWVELAIACLLLLGTLVVEPFYVAGGFALYLNRRSHLEGWDIELSFRRLDSRLQAANKGAASYTAVIMLLGVCVFFAKMPEAHAENIAPAKQESKQIIVEIKKHEDFGRLVKKGGWYSIGEKKAKQQDKPDDMDISSWLEFLKKFFAVGEGVAKLVEGVLWIAVAAVVAVLLVYLSRWLPLFGNPSSNRKTRKNPPSTLFGMDVRPESLPDDVAGEALAQWKRGAYAEAVSMLYRGALATLIDRQGLAIRTSSTEGDCLRQIVDKSSSVDTGTAEYFSVLTGLWQSIAYAHRIPTDIDVEQLCMEWRRHFGIAT